MSRLNSLPRPPTLPSFPPGARRVHPHRRGIPGQVRGGRGRRLRPPRRTRHRPLRRALPALGSPPRVARRVDGPPRSSPRQRVQRRRHLQTRDAHPSPSRRRSLHGGLPPRFPAPFRTREVRDPVLLRPLGAQLCGGGGFGRRRGGVRRSEASAGIGRGMARGVVCGSSRMAPGPPNPSARPARYRSAPRPDPGG